MVLLRNDKNAPKQLKKVDDPATPLAAVPLEEGMDQNRLWLLLAAAVAAGAGVYGYDRHRRKVAANEEAKKYKK